MKRKQLLSNLSKALVRRREALRRVLAERGRMAMSQERAVGDSVDAASDTEQGELDAQLAAVESRELAAIDVALERIRQGNYGLCEACEKPIPAARLTALPFARLCINCQRASELHPETLEGTAQSRQLAGSSLV